MSRHVPDCSEPEKSGPGRPKAVTPDVAEDICRRLIEGESLRKICAGDDMPAKSTVLLHAHNDKAFSDQYARARMLAADSDADDVTDIARKVVMGEIEPAAATAAINGYKWSAGKRNAKRYGDKVALTGGGPGDPPIRVDLTGLSDEELEALERIRSKLADPDRDQSGAGAAEG